ncbi:protein TALPID3 isoform X2 [Mixophyes fleayi]|uniref:protein TALPID3 isoform X2 n=1 Tax=Mixophyes fleayi TaxID=3061075 RepID=UPI003F4E0213
MWEEASDISLDSMASTTASDVLIRSTSVQLTGSQGKGAAEGRGHLTANGELEGDQSSQLVLGAPGKAVVAGGGQESCHHLAACSGRIEPSQVGPSGGSMRNSGQGETGILPARSQDSEGSKVHISVKRLQELPAHFPDFAFKKWDPAYVPPALPANKYPAVKFTQMDGIPDALNGSMIQKYAATKNDSSSPKVLVTKHFEDNRAEKAAMKNAQEGNLQKAKDVQISQFTTGHKETSLAALNKRVQSGPGTKAVRVQLLEDVASKGKKTASAAERYPDCSGIHSATIAAATAAAIAAAAPVLKAQSDLEAQVNSVSQLLNKLQETDRQLQQLTEQQSKIQSQPLERSYHPERVSELERQLSQLTEQRLQHLEKLQQQHLEMQSRFLNSAIKASTSHKESTASVCTHLPVTAPTPQSINLPLKTAPPKSSEREITHQSGNSPLETPAPRRSAPVPISMDVPVPKAFVGKDGVEESQNPASSGQVRFLQQILGHDGTPASGSGYKTHTPLNLTPTDIRPFNDSFLQNDGVRGAKASCPSTTLSSSTAVQKASDVLQDLNTLKQKMQDMMKDAKQWKCEVDEMKPREQPIIPSTSLYKQHPFWRSAVDPPKSMFEDAERVLREVQNNKKVLEDNLDAIIRAKNGAAMYSLISTLASNSSGAEKIRIQKTVDSWINDISSEIQDELAKKDYRKKKPDDRVQESAQRRNAGSTKDIKNNRDRDIKAPARSTLRSAKPSAGVSAKAQCKQSGEKMTGQHSRVLLKKEGGSKVPEKVNESCLMDEEVLNRVYGTPVYQGHRRTLKKGPYLRFKSPSPKSKPQRPKVLETVRGVKLKSAKIQTSSPELSRAVIKSPEFSVPKDYGPQYVFNPSRETGTCFPMEGQLIPMAIPLGRSRFDGAAPLPSSVILARPHSVTVHVSAPPILPKLQANTMKPNVAVVEMKSEKKDPPQLSVQVLPCVDIDSIGSDSPDTSQRAPSTNPTPRTPSPAKTDVQLTVNVESEEEIMALPGSSFHVPEFTQGDQVDEVPEPLLELNGWGETNPPQYGGIPFPPPAPAPVTNADILDGIITRKETLENRLVSWVEQEIMSRVIGEMHAVRQDLVPDIALSSNENSEIESSDIVETAGGKGLQLFVDTGVPVDSNLIRKYVNEALGETIAIMLGEIQKAPAPPPKQPDVQPVPVEIPPVPTPQCTPPSSPLPPMREPSMVKTPQLSPQTSLEESEHQQEQHQDAGQRIPRSHVDTPTITPVASPPRVITPTPLISEDNEDPTCLKSPPPDPWSDMELPLDEENPHSTKQAVQYKDAVVMTVAEEEEPKSLISAATPEPEKSPKQRTPSPVSSAPSSAPSTDESSLTVTGSDTTDKPISEGEVLYSYGQMLAARALAEGGLLYPNLTESLSSTLKDAHDMELDPPSEGQVIRGPHRGAHHDPVLSLLAKFNQNPVAPHEAVYHSESSGDENSMGEISEGQRPRLTTAAEQVLVGHSAFMDGSTNAGQTAGHLKKRPSSPGQCMNIPGPGGSHGDANNISSGPMSIRDLESQLSPAHYPQVEDLHQIPAAARNISQGPGEPQKEHQPVPTRLIQVGVKSGDGPQQGEAAQPSKKMYVTLPSMSEADEDIKSTFVESDSDADTF